MGIFEGIGFVIGYLIIGGVIGYIVSTREGWDEKLFPIVWFSLGWPIFVIFSIVLLVKSILGAKE